MPPIDAYDIFVSYARADNESQWITKFVDALLQEHERTTNRTLTAFFDQTSIRAGNDWELRIAEHLSRSHLFLAFLSPNFLASEWCRREWRAWIDTEIAQHILTTGTRPVYLVKVPGLLELPVHTLATQLVENLALRGPQRDLSLAEIPFVVKHLRRRQLTYNRPFCDVQQLYRDGPDSLSRKDLREVIAALAQDLDEHAERLRRAANSDTTIPAHNARFSGRLDQLLHLRKLLVQENRIGIIHGVSGLGGVGKTELALTYAHAFASEYSGGRFIIRCDRKESLREAIVDQDDFTVRFDEGITSAHRRDRGLHYAAIKVGLKKRIDVLGPIILVLDNITDLKLLERDQISELSSVGPRLHLLATTRLGQPAGTDDNQWLFLDELSEDEGVELLEKHLPFDNEEECAAARRISRRLGGLPLALELVAAFLRERKNDDNVSYSSFLDRLGLEEMDDELIVLDDMAEDDRVALCRHNNERRVAAVLQHSIDRLDAPARRALEYASVLHPDCIAWDWLRVLVGEDHPSVAQPPDTGKPSAWQSVKDQLTALSLLKPAVSPSETKALCRLHRLVGSIVRRNLDTPETTRIRGRSTEYAVRRCQKLQQDWRDSEIRWELTPLIAATRWLAESDPGKGGKLELETGKLLLDLSRFTDAEPLLRQALTRIESYYGPEHLDVAESLDRLATLLHSINRLGEAEPLHRRALAIREKSAGAVARVTAASLNNFARLLNEIGQTAEAERMYRRAVSIFEKHQALPEFARCLINLADLLMGTDRLDGVEAMYRRALTILESEAGPDHQFVGEVLNHLALLLKRTNRVSEARELFRQALSLLENALGPDHLNVASLLNNLAVLTQRTSRYAEAEPMHRRALAIRERILGPHHPVVANSLIGLGAFFLDIGRRSDAEQTLRRALIILLRSGRTTGFRHPDLNLIRDHYKKCLQANGWSSDMIQAEMEELQIHHGLETRVPPGTVSDRLRALLADLQSDPANRDAKVDRIKLTDPQLFREYANWIKSQL